MAQKSAASLIQLDTHVVCWLYAGEVERLGGEARSALATGQLSISPMVELELEYLREIGRLLADPASVVGALANDLGLTVSQTPFPAVVVRAREIAWTADVFDRLIVAQAVADGARLVTKDTRIREHFTAALW
jgi:PIN domain nuclease of toxin-antitoxin system